MLQRSSMFLPLPTPLSIIVTGEKTMIMMPKELQQAVRASQDQPLRLADPETSVEYVLLRADMYDQLKDVFSNGETLTNEERRALLIRAGLRAGWDDPEMDVYNDLDPRRQP